MKPRTRFSALVSWGPRLETPTQLAKRTMESLGRLGRTSSVLLDWYTIRREDGILLLDPRLDKLTSEIAAGVKRAGDGTPHPFYGYRWEAYNSPDARWSSRGFRFGLNAGSDDKYYRNVVNLGTADYKAPDASLVTFEMFRAALLAITIPFEPVFALAYPSTLSNLWTSGQACPTLQLAWISYLAPRFAPLITPPLSAIVEHRPDGGLLMAATDETFDTDNPRHMAVAREIEAAVAPFNALPWPPEPA